MLYNEEIDAYVKKLRENAQEFLSSAGKGKIEIYRIEQFKPVK
jgi:hypothetical protein